MSKRYELASLIDTVKPDIIVGSETRLKPDICQGEFLPDYYNVYRKDRPDGYGGVLLATHSSLNSNQVTVNTDTEFVAAKISTGKQHIIVGSFYRPPYNNQVYMDKISQAIDSLISQEPNTGVWIAGDANLPDIDWTNDQVCRNQYSRSLNETFLQTLARSGLEQVVDFPTRDDKTLDIIITNRPSLVSRCECAPGLSDHDIILLDTSIQANRIKPVRRKIHLWKRADQRALRDSASQLATELVAKHSTTADVDLLA